MEKIVSRKQTAEHCRRVLGRRPPKGLRAEFNRHGNPRWVYRAPGVYHQMKTDPKNTVAFWQEFADVSRGKRVIDVAPEMTMAKVCGPNSLQALFDRYFASRAFAEAAVNTQKSHRDDLAIIGAKVGSFAYSSFDGMCVVELRDRIAETNTVTRANRCKSALSAVFNWAATAEGGQVMPSNPCKSVKKIKHETKNRHPWTAEERTAFEAAYAPGTRERLGYTLAFYTGQRSSDVVRWGRQHIKDGVMQLPNQQKTGKPIWAPICDELTAELAAAKAAGITGALTFITGQGGKAMDVDTFGEMMRKATRAIGLGHCTPHGLRAAAATLAAERGAGVEFLMGVFGFTLQTAQTYIKTANYAAAARRGANFLSHKAA